MRGIADHHNGMDSHILTGERRVHDEVVLWNPQAICMAYLVLLMDRIHRIMSEIPFIWIRKRMIHPKLRNINPHNVTDFLISRNPREQLFIVQISLLIITFLSLILQNLTPKKSIHTFALRLVSTCGASSSSSYASC